MRQNSISFLLVFLLSFEGFSQICSIVASDSSLLIVNNTTNLKKMELSVIDPKTKKPLMQLVREFNQFGKISSDLCSAYGMNEVKKYQYQDNGKMKFFESFENNKVTRKISYNVNGLVALDEIKDGFPYKKREVEYLNNLFITKDIKYLTSSTESVIYFYDSQNRVTKSVFQNESKSLGYFETQWRIFEYDGEMSNPKSVSLSRRIMGNNQNMPNLDSTFVGKIYYTYDTQQRLINEKDEISNINLTILIHEITGNKIVTKSEGGNKSECIFDKIGKELECQYFDFEGKLVSKISKEYNELGKLKKIITYDALNKKTETENLIVEDTSTVKKNGFGDWTERYNKNILVMTRNLIY